MNKKLASRISGVDPEVKPKISGSMSKSELALMYGVDIRTLRNWISRIELSFDPKPIRIFTPAETHEIIGKLGPSDMVHNV